MGKDSWFFSHSHSGTRAVGGCAIIKHVDSKHVLEMNKEGKKVIIIAGDFYVPREHSINIPLPTYNWPEPSPMIVCIRETER